MLDSLFLWEYEANTHLGRWLGAGGVSIPPMSLEESEENLKGPNKQLFLEFLRSMLRWVPEERKTAKELFDEVPVAELRIEEISLRYYSQQLMDLE